MTEHIGLERRKFVRFVVSSPIVFLLFDTEASKQLTEVNHGRMKNISNGGMMLETALLPSKWVNDLISGRIKLMLEFNLPNDTEPIQTFANVAWMTRCKDKDNNTETLQMGVSFAGINSRDRDRINKFVFNNLKK
jgi:c-di-GMP-binding flagellar brake protein YcgR